MRNRRRFIPNVADAVLEKRLPLNGDPIEVEDYPGDPFIPPRGLDDPYPNPLLDPPDFILKADPDPDYIGTGGSDFSHIPPLLIDDVWDGWIGVSGSW